ncbi:response regulator [Flavobacterium terrigena]|uniref:DNA-binding response regulator, NarL/FixJ family, contains REC and HTH domains n=1 Tax=Flavobacterium terrigena TaxID=402734 RepID=A0A1H6S6B6_9FLAO|nr:response regulator transcription factor [Flavobacterium terrigena]SEI60347.1 DNA-binding response regulator, NarL/FixJ family, contains REC and HTH domains [Flavobacterium terrigena]
MVKKFLIIDDHLVVRTGVSILLKEKIEDLQIFNAENFFEAINMLRKQVFDLVILDINIPGGKNTEMIQEIKIIQPTVKVLVFSAYEEEQYASRYIISGANGYLNKLCSEEKMITVVTSILETGKYIPTEIALQIANAGLNKKVVNPLVNLSKREFEIVELLVNGNGNLEICNKLNIHMSTVSTYKVRVFEKLKINNLVELIDIYKSYN